MSNRRKPEIMSPAGHWPQMHAAIEAGADAIYFGLKHFTARAKVGFSLEELPEAMQLLHSRGVRGYLTFNTLVFEHELPFAAEAIAAVAKAGVDALIIQDIGVVRLAREIAPDIEIHASTQMSITDVEGVRFAQSLGVNRVTLARELTLTEIRTIYEKTGCDLEMFVHGALCVAYSGQCFSSEAWGGRSANRGQCAQACRLPYDLIVDGAQEPLADARYLLSPGDLCTVEELQGVVEAGVGALKIEGRYKDPDYVALTTSTYRRALDSVWEGRSAAITKADELRLEQVYSRGLGPWFIEGTNHQAVVSGRAPRHRGVLMGRVERVEQDRVVVHPEKAHRISPLKPGDGVVFDAADWRSPEEQEEGGRVYEINTRRDGAVEILFGNRAVDFARIRPGDLMWRTDDPTLHDSLREFTEATTPVYRRPVDIAVAARPGEPLVSVWTVRGAQVEVYSPAPLQPARNQGLTRETLRDQFGRLGNTQYRLGELTLSGDAAVFAPTSILNQMRREAVEKLQNLQGHRPTPQLHDPADALQRLTPTVPVSTEANAEPELHLLVRTPEQLDAALDMRPHSITLDYLDLYGLRPSVERVKASGVRARVASPRILKPGEAKIVDFLVSFDCDIVLRGAGMLHAIQERAERYLIGDFSLNAANSIAAAEYFRLGVDRLTPTHDLNAAQVADLARRTHPDQMEVIAYQHLPVFHTEHCVFCRFLSTGTSYKDCGRPCESHKVELRDHTGRAHPLMADVGCRNTVFGAEAQEASGHLDRWRAAGIRHYRLEFVHESGEQVREITEAWRAALDRAITPAQLNRRLRSVTPGGTTQGSLQITSNYLELPILQ